MLQRIAVLYGGPSSEHEVSVKSAHNVLESIDREQFAVIEVFISRDGFFHIEDRNLQAEDAINLLKTKCDVVFPVLHGAFGEDGKLQKMLEDEGICFIGSGSAASRIAIYKSASNDLFEKNGISIPKSQIITKENKMITIAFPIIVKPVSEGSSIGLHRFDSQEDMESQLAEIFSHQSEMLAQECVIGREFTCGVIEMDGKPVALPITEILTKGSSLFDYKTKYTAGECEEVTPANIDESLTKKIQAIVLECHRLLECKSISRTDVIISDDQTIYVLETNTLPGMTKTSFIPQQTAAYGLSMMQLVTLLIRSARKE